MSEQWPEFGSEQSTVASEPNGASSANGVNAEDADAVLDASAEASLATSGEAADESPVAAELITDGDPVSGSADDSAEATAADDGAAGAADEARAAEAPADEAPADEGSVFLAELVRAMQATAGIERARIGEDTAQRRQAHIDQVRAREASEADRMRELADDDMKAIEAWTDGETARIQLERERRATELHEDLDASLAEHRSKTDREIEGVEAAIASYQAEVDAFFEGLDRETDPILIATQAARRPVFPTLEAVADTSAAAPEAGPASAETTPAGLDDGATGAGTADATEPAVIGVMDSEATAEPVEAWAAQPEVSPEPASAGASDEIDQGGEDREPAEPVVAATGSSRNGVGSLFESVPVLRPMSWLRRDPTAGDRSSRNG